MKSARTELLLLDKIVHHRSEIAELTSSVEDLVRRSSVPRTNELDNNLIHAGYIKRKMHCYQLQYKYHLHYLSPDLIMSMADNTVVEDCQNYLMSRLLCVCTLWLL